MSEYKYTGRARISDIDEMADIMFTKDKIEHSKKFRERNLSMIQENLSYVYRINNKLVGFIILTKKENNEILIFTLFVDENYRRRGIGSKLIKFSMDNARFIHKDAYFSLHVMVTNENALNLYKKLGFKITKTIPDFYLWLIPDGGKREEGKNYDGYEMEYHFD